MLEQLAQIFAIVPTTIPTPAAIGLGLVGLGVGMVWMRTAAHDKLAAARRLSASTAAYYVRAENARNQTRAIQEPTQYLDLVQLRAATATRREQLIDWAHGQVAYIRNMVTPNQTPPDWADGEMTQTFILAGNSDDWNEIDTMALPVNPLPQPPRAHELPAPPPTVVPALVIAPWSEQTPARAIPARRDPAKRLLARSRNWNASLLGLRVPPLSMPELPRPFQMPQARIPRQLPHSPARMAMLKPDPMRRWRRPAQVAM